MSSLNKASESNFKTYLDTAIINTIEIDDDAAIGGDLIVTGTITTSSNIQSQFSRPELEYDLITNPTWYRAMSSITMASQVNSVATGVTPNNIDLAPKNNGGADIDLYSFGTNFKLDLDINAAPSNTNNFLEIQLINEDGAVISADYFTKIYRDSANPAAVNVGPVGSFQLQTGRAEANQLSMNLSFSLNSDGANGVCSMNGTFSSYRIDNNSLERNDVTAIVKNIGAKKISTIRLRINNANHTGYAIRTRLYSCA